MLPHCLNWTSLDHHYPQQSQCLRYLWARSWLVLWLVRSVLAPLPSSTIRLLHQLRPPARSRILIFLSSIRTCTSQQCQDVQLGQDLHCPQLGQGLHCPHEGQDLHCPHEGQDLHWPQLGQDLHCPLLGQRLHCPHEGQDLHCPHEGQDLCCPQLGQHLHCPHEGQDLHCPHEGQDLHCPQLGWGLHCPLVGQDLHCPSQVRVCTDPARSELELTQLCHDICIRLELPNQLGQNMHPAPQQGQEIHCPMRSGFVLLPKRWRLHCP